MSDQTYKLVPVEPTPKMRDAGVGGLSDSGIGDAYEDDALRCYAAMVAAAPEPVCRFPPDDAIDMLRPEARIAELEAERDALLRDCWEACGGKGPDSSDDELVGTISTMRVGLERWQKRACDAEAERDALQAENAQLRDVLADRDMDREMAARSKLELIEANRQRDALRVRIEGAQIFQFSSRARIEYAGLAEVFVPCEVLGKRVALVVLGDEE